MTVKETLDSIDGLKKELDALLPLKGEDDERLWKKIRLDWNYNSNHIEGSTLTYRQTELLLLKDVTEKGPSHRENEEMKAHDLAIYQVRSMASDLEHPLTESFIKELNRIILVREFYKVGQTIDGQPAPKLIKIGNYKDSPNGVRLQNGEYFEYASPLETPILMKELMDFYNTNSASTETHSLWLAAMFHYKFVRIHPFDDGNGRIARLLMNYILLKKGYPPAIVLAKDKANYLQALSRADSGDTESFVIYIGEQLIRTLKMSIDAAKGKSIEEKDDVDMELELLKRNLTDSEEVRIKKSRDVVKTIYNESLRKLFFALNIRLEKFNELFNEISHRYIVFPAVETTIMKSPGKDLIYFENQINFEVNNPQLYGQVDNLIYRGNNPPTYLNTGASYQYPEIHKLTIEYAWKGFKKVKKAEANIFSSYVTVYVDLFDFKYVIGCSENKIEPLNKLYHQYLTDEECDLFAAKIARVVLDDINRSLDRE